MINRTRRRLEVERLEAKRLLASGSVGLALPINPGPPQMIGPVSPGGGTGGIATLPTSKPSQTTLTNGFVRLDGLTERLTTDRAFYHAGQTVRMTLTETNITTHPVAVSVGPSIDGFSITHNGAVVYRSNGGMQPMFIMLRTLQPGQSLTLTATWKAVGSGTFVVHNQRTTDSATFNVD
jgi:hypothetical protein